jgi:hypothetical protein
MATTSVVGKKTAEWSREHEWFVDVLDANRRWIRRAKVYLPGFASHGAIALALGKVGIDGALDDDDDVVVWSTLKKVPQALVLKYGEMPFVRLVPLAADVVRASARGGGGARAKACVAPSGGPKRRP